MARQKTDFQDIAEIFASFYERLYESQAEISTLDSNRAALPSITLQELRATFAKAKKNRACADDGLAMEMLQELPDSALTLLAMLLTDVLRATARPPTSWQVSRLTVLLKKGDAKLPKKLPTYCCHTSPQQGILHDSPGEGPRCNRATSSHLTGWLQERDWMHSPFACSQDGG